VFEFYEPTAEDNQIAFELRRTVSTPQEVRGDPNLLFEALANPSENAVKFAPPGDHVRLTVFRDRTGAGVIFPDDEPSIAPAGQHAVMRRFCRGEASRHTPDSGLGLSFALAVSRMHGMSIRFKDTTPGCEAFLYKPTD
jgi:K+-sensing histidine kinase KdpD